MVLVTAVWVQKKANHSGVLSPKKKYSDKLGCMVKSHLHPKDI